MEIRCESPCAVKHVMDIIAVIRYDVAQRMAYARMQGRTIDIDKCRAQLQITERIQDMTNDILCKRTQRILELQRDAQTKKKGDPA